MAESWWAIEGATFTGHVLEKAANARAALAAARRAFVEADRANGASQRDAEAWTRAADLRVAAGPWTLEQAITFEVEMRWAWKICDTVIGGRSVPVGPASREEAIRYLGRDETARIERFVRSVHTPSETPPSVPADPARPRHNEL